MAQSKKGALLFGLLGAGVLAITAIINFKFGHSLALDKDTAMLQAVSGLAIDVCGAALAVVAVALWRGDSRAGGVVVGLIMAGCVGYSMLSVVGFGAQGRVAKSTHIERQAKAKAEAIEKQNSVALQQRHDALSWLQSTYSQASKGEKQTLVDAVTNLSSRPVDIVVADAGGEMADAQGTILASMLGMSLQSAQTTMITLLAILLKVSEVACFGVSSALWPRENTQAGLSGGLIKNGTFEVTENQGLRLYPLTQVSHQTNKSVNGKSLTTDTIADQFALNMPWTEEAARRQYDTMDPSLRDGLSHQHLADKWSRNRVTVAKWRRQWDAERKIAAAEHANGGAHLLNGRRPS